MQFRLLWCACVCARLYDACAGVWERRYSESGPGGRRRVEWWCACLPHYTRWHDAARDGMLRGVFAFWREIVEQRVGGREAEQSESRAQLIEELTLHINRQDEVLAKTEVTRSNAEALCTSVLARVK